MTELDQIEPRNALGDDVYAALLRSIIEGEYPAHSRLKEREISQRFAVSRVPVREALRRLEADGFVVSEQNRGARVVAVTTTDINDIFDLRLCIEPFAASRAAERVAAGEASTTRLRQLLVMAETSTDPDTAQGANLDFHAEIVSMSANAGLVRALAPVRGRMEWIFRLTRDQRGVEHALEHRQLLEAIDAGNERSAAALTTAHIEMGRAPILTALADLLEN